MTTLEFEARKAELAREILCNDSAEVIDAVKKAYHRIAKRVANKPTQAEKPTPYTIEELHARIAESEADEEAGRMCNSEEVFARLEQKVPFLCK